MIVIKNRAEITPKMQGAAVAIGNFDGMHRGHEALLAQLQREAKTRQSAAGVLTFEPHPRKVFRPEGETFRLTLSAAKRRRLAQCGVDFVWEQRFDRPFSQRTAAAFIDELLVDALDVRHVIVGEDFHFGHDRAGDVTFLRAAGERRGFSITALAPILAQDGTVYSASRIRALLQAGDPKGAATLLGRPWDIEGLVVPGDRRGRDLGFPTANLELGDHLHPAYGVYAVCVGIANKDRWDWQNGVANIGRRPTVSGQVARVEAHLFDFKGDLYGQTIRVALVEFLRPERKFPDLSALKEQIAQDCKMAQAGFKAYPPPIATL
ncbi:MAG: bifunctional riboflavin kinase/FAD synthetase [Alphaproteobacteria bacterium]